MATGLLTIEAITSQTRYAVTVNEVVRWEVGEQFWERAEVLRYAHLLTLCCECAPLLSLASLLLSMPPCSDGVALCGFFSFLCARTRKEACEFGATA